MPSPSRWDVRCYNNQAYEYGTPRGFGRWGPWGHQREARGLRMRGSTGVVPSQNGSTPWVRDVDTVVAPVTGPSTRWEQPLAPVSLSNWSSPTHRSAPAVPAAVKPTSVTTKVLQQDWQSATGILGALRCWPQRKRLGTGLAGLALVVALVDLILGLAVAATPAIAIAGLALVGVVLGCSGGTMIGKAYYVERHRIGSDVRRHARHLGLDLADYTQRYPHLDLNFETNGTVRASLRRLRSHLSAKLGY